MQRIASAIVLMVVAATAQAQVAGSCGTLSSPQMGRSTAIASIAPEIATPARQLGAPAGVLAQALDESLSVEQVLFRMKLEGCERVASITPAPVPGTLPASAPASTLPVSPGSVTAPASAIPSSTDPAAYKPRTEFDNAPWRFDMNQNGKRMTADEFTAWMKSKGVRVAKGAPSAAAPSNAAPVTADGEVLIPAAPIAAPVTPGLPADATDADGQQRP